MSRPKLIIYDTLCEYTDGIICEDYQTLCQAWLKVYDKPNYKLVYQPADPMEYFDSICARVYSCGDITFLVEEVDTFLSLNTSGLSRSFLNIIQRGRHNNIEFIGITQRPYALPAILRSQCKELYTFRQFEKRDLDWLKGILGESANEVEALQQYEYIEFVDGSINKGKTKSLSKALPILQKSDEKPILQKGYKPEIQESDVPKL